LLAAQQSDEAWGWACPAAGQTARRNRTLRSVPASVASAGSLIPMISAACHHVIFFAKARNMTSCTFIARSMAVFE
jgi:hypothetical protein